MDRPLTRDEALARCAWVHTEDGVDETCIQLFHISAANAGYLFLRQVWWFEEESLQWTLDESQEWWMPNTEAHALIHSLHDALTPSGVAQKPPPAG